jgi:HEPN domain-containing protein
MKQPEEAVIRKILGDWLNKAEQDMESAETLLSREPPLLSPSCFHSQQAAEKYLKAYLTWRQVEFPKTHSIREIVDLVRTVDEGLARSISSAAALTPYGVEVRYPGDVSEPKRQEAEEALGLARGVRKAVLRMLPSFEA